MKRLNKYLLWTVIRFLVITEMAGLAMFVTIEFFEHMDLFAASFNNFMLGLTYLALRTPYYFNLILPLAFLISMLTAFILMIRSNEMVIVRTSGISTISLMKPFVSFAMILVILSFALTEWVIPVTVTSSEYMYRVRIKKEESHVFFKNDKIWFKRGRAICNVDFYDAKKDAIRGLTVLELSKDYSVKRRLDAREGVWKNGAWTFTDVTERTFSKDVILSVQKHAVMEGIIKEPPSVFRTTQRNPEEMGYRDLSKYVKRLKRDGHDARRYLVDMYDKIAFPFINLIMVFAAFSVGLRYVRTRHISKGIFSGILVGACYWFVHAVSLSFGRSEVFPPIFAAWLANFIFLSFGVIGVVTLRT